MPLLEVDGVNVSFGGHHALRDVSFSVDEGTITGLIGPNGAGKTTTFNVICGLQEVTAGRLRFGDQNLGRLRPHQRARLGIARTFQRLEVFGSMTARDNVVTAAEIHAGWSGSTATASAGAVADELLELVGASGVARERVDSLPTGLARLVELARALATHPRLLLLDEPASGLDEAETQAFGALLLSLAARGTTVLMVEHDVPLVMATCSQIYVLDFGAVLASGTPDEIRSNRAVLDAYLGTAP